MAWVGVPELQLEDWDVERILWKEEKMVVRVDVLLVGMFQELCQTQINRFITISHIFHRHDWDIEGGGDGGLEGISITLSG